MPNFYANVLPLVGKLLVGWNIDFRNTTGLTDSERDICEQALREHLYYHGNSGIGVLGGETSPVCDSTGGYQDSARDNVEAGTKRKPGRPPKG